MTVERNVEGLRSNAQRKRQETFDKVEQGIQKLIQEKRVINFNTVADASGVSKAWLYKQPKIKEKIEGLRQNHPKSQEVPVKQKASDASKDTIIKTLKERVKKVEAENRGLREQLEVAYGRILSVSELEHQVEYLEKQNLQLQEELQSCQSQLPKHSSSDEPNTRSFSSKKAGKISNTIKNELDALAIALNTTLTAKIRNAEEKVVLNAIEALKEQLQHKVIPNPGGWLSKAIDGAWQPNKPLGETHPADIFAQWHGLAREFGIVIGSRKENDGSTWVQENTGRWFPFEEFSSKWTLEYLQRRQ
ncbi:hypothetical protein NIES4103_13600 [Nostoc sp. NIES-4103]|nr:hypothetical protein NIES4103_13600 [Nostoc sp. NIES-4103]